MSKIKIFFEKQFEKKEILGKKIEMEENFIKKLKIFETTKIFCKNLNF